ncbi:MAG: site-2 protease family protein [Clostridia bacterium]|nr:site-2 protease family protein [Clostridia bacterium]
MIDFRTLILTAMAVLITLSIHEYSHAYAAYKLGDDTAKNLGRLSLNPIKHLDPIGALCMLFFHVGWAKPVPINSRNFKNPKRDFALSALAGPLSNLILAFFSMGLYLFSLVALTKANIDAESLGFSVAQNLLIFLYIFQSVNVGLGVFNLLPIPPFDGSRLLNVIFPPKIYFGIMKYERYIYYGVLGWLLLGDYVAIALRSVPFIATSSILYNIVGIFSLSDMLSIAIAWISGLMLDFWQLFPIFQF